jgi:hypothetical protein
MVCEHKWVTHAALLTQSMFVMVYDWFWVEILAMVWNGPLHEYYQGRTDHVCPMRTRVTLGSHFTLNAPTPSKPALTHLELCLYATGAVGTPFVHIKCGELC